MASHIIRAGYPVIGYDVLAERRGEHRREGGVVARSAADVIRRCGITITSLPSAAALLNVAAQAAGLTVTPRIVVETSTMPLAVKEQARVRFASAGITLLDCPLSGTGSQARVKDLVVFVSGDRSACHRAASIMSAFSRAHYYVGPFGAGSKTKFVANLLVAIHNVAAAEAMVLAMKAGLDPEMTLKVMGDGAGSSRMLQVRGPMMVRGDYSTPTMKLDVWQKDMNAIAEFARDVKCPTPLFTLTEPFYMAARASGRGGEDTGAVCSVLESLAHYERPRPGRARRNNRD